MEAIFDSLAFALFIAAHLFAAIALSVRNPGPQRGGTPRNPLWHAGRTPASVRVYVRATAGNRGSLRSFGVKYALEASIRRDRRQLRVNMRLIDGQTSLHLWAESFERPSSDLMSVRDTFIEIVLSCRRRFLRRRSRSSGSPECGSGTRYSIACTCSGSEQRRR
jgi:hypothetical protein